MDLMDPMDIGETLKFERDNRNIKLKKKKLTILDLKNKIGIFHPEPIYRSKTLLKFFF